MADLKLVRDRPRVTSMLTVASSAIECHDDSPWLVKAEANEDAGNDDVMSDGFSSASVDAGRTPAVGGRKIDGEVCSTADGGNV
mmetsp:Transcript_45081/g.124950  ORF Transcript_45081/g.124950 Transcript_45081/m.124950 type:complete len:84 (+) Transcript_45081:707-958(+)